MKIIAVDDEKIALMGLVSSIEKAAPEATVTGYRSPAEALSHAREDAPDVAFLDIEMKGMSGVTLAAELKEINPQVNIIFATGFGSFRDVAFDLHASGYLIKPITAEGVRRELDNLRRPVAAPKRLRVITFGNFEVLLDGEPLVFKYRKSKELFAYLIDRNGAMCSAGELMSVLFEDDGDHRAYYHRIRSDLTATLAAYGCEAVLSQQRGLLGVVTGQVDCDYFDYLSGRAELSRLYRGEYMSQYSFAEVTNGELFAQAKK